MEEGLSLSEAWKIIMRKKIMASILFGAFTIFFIIFFEFVYNPLFSSYEIQFNYWWYGIEENKYANGQIFNYYDIISLENLYKVQSSKEEYHSIKITDVKERTKISVTENNEYVLTSSGRSFSDSKQARDFLEDLIKLPYQLATQLEFDFKSNLKGFYSANKVSTKLTFLENQLSMITKGYEGMIGYFGDVSFEESRLSSRLRELEVFASNDALSEYQYLAYQNAYMTKEEYRTLLRQQEALTTEQALLRARKKTLLDSLKNIYENSNGNTYMDTSIANYLNSLHSLDTRLMKIDEEISLNERASLGKYDEIKSEAFLQELETYAKQIEKFSDDYTQAVQNVLKTNSLLNIQNIQAKGEIPLFLTIPISFVLGILGSLGITFLISYFSKKEN